MRQHLTHSFTPILIGILFLGACASRSLPPMSFMASRSADASPTYSDINNWVAHPAKKDSADCTPPNASPENQAEAVADVFFIHPTTYLKGDTWNASLDNAELNTNTESRAVRHQASAFNAAGRIYAPRYRQMVLTGFYTKDSLQEKSKKAALAFAYQDVKKAFAYYLEHENKGRPIIIASHSQGSFHGIRIMKEFFDEKPLAKQLVAAYLVGWPFPAEAFNELAVCDDPTQTGCVMGWASWKRGKIPKNYDNFYKGAVATNPLNWRSDDTYAADSLHLGLLMGDFKTIHKNRLEVEGHKGLLWVEKPIKLWPKNNFHIADINLFWFNIRENAVARVAAWQEKQKLAH